MAPNAPGQFAHFLTEKSVELGRDTFVFTYDKKTESETLLIGLNQSVTQASTATLLRWLKYIEYDLQDIKLHPARMQKLPIAPFSVHVVEGSVKPRLELSDEPIPPGEYVWIGRKVTIPPAPSLAKLRDRYYRDPQLQRYVGRNIDLYKFPDGWKATVLERDEGKCFMTGRQSATKETPEGMDIWWIFPPTWGYWLEVNSHPATHDVLPYLTPNNVILMDERLIADFHDNAFGVDVDDSHGRRIVRFRPFKSDVELPEYLPERPSGYYDHIDDFLRMHFDFCIQACVFGGDIHEETQYKIPKLMSRLGVRVATGEHEFVKDDPEWLTVMGKGILDMLVMQEAITEEEAMTFGVPAS